MGHDNKLSKSTKSEMRTIYSYRYMIRNLVWNYLNDTDYNKRHLKKAGK